MRLNCGQNYTFAPPRTVPKMSIFRKWSGNVPDYQNLSLSEWQHRTNAALSWLQRSIAATGGKGSSHSYSPVFGWQKAYPETTGYLIETLFDYADLTQNNTLRELAFQCTDWLVSIQLPGGAFPGLLAGNTKPSIFNTSQILFGLARALEEDTGRVETRHALRKAVEWLVSQLEPDYSWRRHAYVPGFTPSYYTRAVWGVLKANKILQIAGIENAMKAALQFYAHRIMPEKSVKDWGFWPGKPAFTHTIAYTLEGFLESAIVLKDDKIIEKKILAGEKLLLIIADNKDRLAGRYDEHWRGDYSFRCVTGNCQLSVFFHRLWELTGDGKFQKAAGKLLMDILDCQILDGSQNAHGALPGSAPFWGPYQRFRYPNWGVKFFLDAMRVTPTSGWH